MTAHQTLLARYVDKHPDEVARRCEAMSSEGVTSVLQTMDAETAADLLRHLAPVQAVAALSTLRAAEAAAILAALPPDVSATLLRRVEPATAASLIELLPPAVASPVKTIISYPPNSAGGVMDPLVLTAPLSATVGDVRSLVTRFPDHLYYYVYVVDDHHRLVGVLDLAELFQSDAAVPVPEAMHEHVSTLSAEASLEAVFAHPAWQKFDALPVVTDDQRFIGAIRHRRMRQLLEAHEAAGRREPGVETVMALGEIYWLGLCGLLQGISVTASETVPVAGGRAS